MIADQPQETLQTAPRRPIVIPWIVIAVIVLLIVGFGIALARSHQDSIDGGPAPDFTLKPFNGGTFQLSQKRGKVVLVNFWASWCGPCRAEAPLLNTLWNEYKNKGVEFIGVDYLDNRSDAQQFIKNFNMSYPAAPDDGTQVSSLYRVHAVPETYLIDKNGVIAYHLPVPVTTGTANNMRALLDKLLAA